MTNAIYHDGDEGVELVVRETKTAKRAKGEETSRAGRSPVHVIYGGAHLFRRDTVEKLGKIALAAVRSYAPSFVEFAHAMHLPGTETLPNYPKAVSALVKQIEANEKKIRTENRAVWTAWAVYQRTLEKLKREPVEDLRIDFEDGYGSRPESEEDADAEASAIEYAAAFKAGKLPEFSGIRIRSFAKETLHRAARTLDIFTDTLLKETDGELPPNFVVTLPKAADKKHVRALCERLRAIEKKHKLAKGSLKIEVVIESPLAIIDRKGKLVMRSLIEAAKGRCTSAHFGAYDYTSSVGISGRHTDLRHPACDFARQIMLASLSPLGIRLADSVTTEIPVPVHRGEELTKAEKIANERAVHSAWKKHFANVSASMANGFYQSWDLHPNQLAARYAAVYFFYLDSFDEQKERLKHFVENAAKARLSGTAFDDEASAQGVVNFFRNALDCRALTESEVVAGTGLSAEEIRAGSFKKIMETRRNS